jgi:hypothetical protein
MTRMRLLIRCGTAPDEGSYSYPARLMEEAEYLVCAGGAAN